ncbi:MAG: glycosyltransferase [Pelobium sp.]
MNIYINYSFLFLYQVCFLTQLYYLLVIQRKFTVYKSNVVTDSQINFPLSVIICARNEAKNLAQYLPFVLEQDYPDFEVVVVNDCSSDNSEDILRGLQSKYAHLKVVKIEEHPRYKTAKKFAATLGIKASSNEILVFTDADCKPESTLWLSLIASKYQNPATEIILGYSPYQRFGGILNALIRFETFHTALNYFSYALNGMPYMGVGRNLSYKKSLFFKGKGFASHMHIPSGDDDLFVNQNATEGNVEIEVNTNSHTLSIPKQSWKDYWNQKIRHSGAGNMYKKHHKINLSFQAISAMGFYVLVIVCLALKVEPIVIGIVFIVRLIAQVYVYYRPMQSLKAKDLIWWFIFLDPFYYFYLLILSIASFFKKKVSWK